MAEAARFVLPYQTVIDAAGVPIPGAKLWFYESGTDIPLNTYSDHDLTIPNANPVKADAAGQFGNIFMLYQPYKVVLTDDLDDEIWTADPVLGGGISAATQTLRRVTADTTILDTDVILEVDATAGNVKVTYPIALGTPQQTQAVRVVKIDTSGNFVNIVDDGSATIRYSLIDPAAGALMQSALIYSNGTALRVLD